MNTKTDESSEEESGESDVELELAPPSLSATVQSTGGSQLQDSLLEEEQELEQPLVVNTMPVISITQNTENLENEERVMVDRFLQDGCGCDLHRGGCSSTFTADSLEGYRRDCRELTRA